MKKSLTIGFTILLCLLNLGVQAEKTTLQQPWVDRGYINNNDAFQNILVIGVPDHPDERRQLEDSMVKALSKMGVEATASLDIMSIETEVNKENVVSALEGRSVEGVLLTRVFRVEDIETVQGGDPGTMRTERDFAIQLWANYEGARDQALNAPKHKEHRLVLENNLYETRSENLVWTVQSYTIDPKSSDKVIKSLSKLVSEQLRKDNFI